jgi:hypothetical protein
MGGRSGLVCLSITLLSPVRNARLAFVSTTVEIAGTDAVFPKEGVAKRGLGLVSHLLCDLVYRRAAAAETVLGEACRATGTEKSAASQQPENRDSPGHKLSNGWGPPHMNGSEMPTAAFSSGVPFQYP